MVEEAWKKFYENNGALFKDDIMILWLWVTCFRKIAKTRTELESYFLSLIMAIFFFKRVMIFSYAKI